MDEFVPTGAEKRAKTESILEQSRKSKNINIRIREHDLHRLKELAQREGMPYQTLIASILHKYVTRQLVDEEQILKSLELVGKTEQRKNAS
jgi:hypothetical protein